MFLDELTNMDLIDSTLIIFMSDNGYLIGEHQLLEKESTSEAGLGNIVINCDVPFEEIPLSA